MVKHIFDHENDVPFVARILREAERVGVHDPREGQLRLVVGGVSSPDAFRRDDLDDSVHRLFKRLKGMGLAPRIFQDFPRSEIPTISPDVEASEDPEPALTAKERAALDEIRFTQLRISRLMREFGNATSGSRSRGLVFAHLDHISRTLSESITLTPKLSLVDADDYAAFARRASCDLDAIESIAEMDDAEGVGSSIGNLITDVTMAIVRSRGVERERLRAISGDLAELRGGELSADYRALMMEGVVRARQTLDPYPEVGSDNRMDPILSDAFAEIVRVGNDLYDFIQSQQVRGHANRRIAQLEASDGRDDVACIRSLVDFMHADFGMILSIVSAGENRNSLMELFGRIRKGADEVMKSSKDEVKAGRLSEELLALSSDVENCLRSDDYVGVKENLLRAHILTSKAILPYDMSDGAVPPDGDPFAGMGGDGPPSGGSAEPGLDQVTSGVLGGGIGCYSMMPIMPSLV